MNDPTSRDESTVFCPPAAPRCFTLLSLLALIALTGTLSALAAPSLFPGLR